MTADSLLTHFSWFCEKFDSKAKHLDGTGLSLTVVTFVFLCHSAWIKNYRYSAVSHSDKVRIKQVDRITPNCTKMYDQCFLFFIIWFRIYNHSMPSIVSCTKWFRWEFLWPKMGGIKDPDDGESSSFLSSPSCVDHRTAKIQSRMNPPTTCWQFPCDKASSSDQSWHDLAMMEKEGCEAGSNIQFR